MISVRISNIRLDPTLEDQLIKQWSTNWLKNARAESEQLDRMRSLLEIASQEEARVKYARLVSREINELARKRKPEAKEMLTRHSCFAPGP